MPEPRKRKATSQQRANLAGKGKRKNISENRSSARPHATSARPSANRRTADPTPKQPKLPSASRKKLPTGQGGVASNRTAASHGKQVRQAAPGAKQHRSASASAKQQRVSTSRSKQSPRTAQGSTVGSRHVSDNLWQKNPSSSNRKAPKGAQYVGAKQPKTKKNPIASVFGAIGSFFTKSLGGKIAAVLIIAFCLFGLVDGIVHFNKIYSNVYVGTVAVGGMSVEDAEKAISDTYEKQLGAAEITICRDKDVMADVLAGKEVKDLETSEEVSVEEAAKAQKTWPVTLETLGGGMNYAKLAKEAYDVDRTGIPILNRLATFVLGSHITPTIEFNDSAVEKLGMDIDQTMGETRVNYNIEVVDGKAKVTDGHDGDMIERPWMVQEITLRMLDPELDQAFVAEIKHAPLQITEEQAEKVADEVNSAIEHGASFTFGPKSWDADRATVGSWVSTRIEDKGGYQLIPYINADVAKPALQSKLRSEFNAEENIVTFTKDSRDNVTVETTASGTIPLVSMAIEQLSMNLFDTHTVDQKKLDEMNEEERKAIENVSNDGDGSKITVQSAELPEKMTVEAALDYGIISEIASYTTDYTGSAANRNTNIHLAADLLNNSIVEKNGGIWSYFDITGECNEEKGFVGAGVIVSGQTVDSVGGGICQVATTVFNAVYDSGLPIVERHNHTLYNASYPEGRDAAVNWKDLNLKWKNDQSSDILVRTSYTDTTVTVTLYGVDPEYKVTSELGPWVEGAKFVEVKENDPDLYVGGTYVKQNGADGHSRSITRTVTDKDGKVIRTDTFDSNYSPKNKIIVVGTKQ